ncbi:MAG: ankyrin repeat domain-containing protein [Betaproteobacteria bacterium]|nr:ankyrin repeat domain-containing protein [Betaproteobacteria bacterium]
MQAALLEAIDAGDLAAVQAAVKRGADLNAPGPFQRTPLHHAAKTVGAEVIEWMLAHGANLDARDGDGRAPLHRANSVSAEVFLRHGANALAKDRQGTTALHVAAEEDRSMCRLLISAGVPVNVRNGSGLTPLHFSVLQGKQQIVEALVDLGADVNARTESDYSYKWSYIGWDVKGHEQTVPAGSTPISLARWKHKDTRWTSGRTFTELAEFLRRKGAIERSWWRFWD